MSDSKSKLSPESKEEVRKYVLSMLVLPASVLSVLGFALGWFINEGARGAAYAEAYGKAQTEVIKLATAASTSATKAQIASEYASDAQLDLQQSLNKIQNTSREIENYGEKIRTIDNVEAGFASEVAKSLLENPDVLSLKITESFGTRLDGVEKQLSEVKEIGNSSACTWVPVTNISGGHNGATQGKEWTGQCPVGSYVRSYKLSTWGQLATYHHSIQCCTF